MRSNEASIAGVFAWEALDSRGDPTVACTVVLRGGARGSAMAPAGASKGSHEAPELRDGGDRYGGMGCARAVVLVNDKLEPLLLGVNASDQAEVDARLGPAGSSGANATLAVSVAAARAAASYEGLSLWRYLEPTRPPLLPMPMVQILAGGAHAGRNIDIQDVLVVPTGARSFREAIEVCAEVRRKARERADARGWNSQVVGDEGGLALPFSTNREALEFVAASIDAAGRDHQAELAIDVAANQLLQANGTYRLETQGVSLRRQEWVAELSTWVAELPICSIEDPLEEDDWEGWSSATAALGRIQIVGDDLFATQEDRLRRGVVEGAANAVLIKPNQRGTLSEAERVLAEAKRAGYRTIVSARSGDTEESWLADLAVGWRTAQIKVGSITRSERVAKWNRLLEIESTERDAELANPFA